jgi:hypothetical protein
MCDRIHHKYGRAEKTSSRSRKDYTLGGKMMMVVEAFNHRPVATWYNPEAKANDKSFAEKLLKRLPTQGLLIFDLGFFSFVWFDAFTCAQKFFVTESRGV